MRKYVKFMIILFLILFLILVLDITRKFIILNNCTKKISETNYYMKVISYSGENIIITEKYLKDDTSIVKMIKNDSKYVIYRSPENEKMIATINGITETITDPNQIPNINLNPNDKSLVTPTIGTAIAVRISSEKCNGKDCYLIEDYNGVRVWIEKDTGLMIRTMNEISYNNDTEFNNVNDYFYRFNQVTDIEVAEPL